jgi:hypothetical protein
MVLPLGEFVTVTLEELLIEYFGWTKDSKELVASPG